MIKYSNCVPFIISIIVLSITLQSCASTGYSVKEPHYYNNSYSQVLKAIEIVLNSENMEIVTAEELDEKTYRIKFIKRRARTMEQSYEATNSAEITVRKVADKRTSIKIKENFSKDLVRDVYRQNLARDIFDGLEEILLLEAPPSN